MTKREAKQAAHRLVVNLIDQAMRAGNWSEYADLEDAYTDADRAHIEAALDDIAQHHFNLGSKKEGSHAVQAD